MERKIPEAFIIGTASASYQVEGAAYEDGREESIWDTFSRKPGATYAGESGTVAVDQYHRYREDIAMMKDLGFQSYRFSISWGRVIKADGTVNREGIGYYRSLCQELRRAGMTASATLYHWDLPQYLEARGGWRERETAYRFAEYASVCFSALGGLVDMWITLNEPYCVSYLGFVTGEHAPGEKGNLDAAGKVIHHLNLAHGLAVQAFRESGTKGRIGITWNALPCRAAEHVEDKERLENLQYDIDNGVFTGPVLKGAYPEGLGAYGLSFPLKDGDLSIIKQRIDFIGLNYYHEDLIEPSPVFPFYKAAEMDVPRTDMGWPVTPAGLVRLLRRMEKESGGIDMYITENGAAYDDVLSPDGKVCDTERVSFLRGHILACLDALDEGLPLKGYYIWSFTDNFEWAWGYTKRFGIVYIDYKTLRRIPKDSAFFMKEVNTRRAVSV